MVRPLPQEDFRSVRRVLDPEDFIFGAEEPEIPPTDLIDQTIWDHLAILDDDVLIRTTDHFGTLTRYLTEVANEWVELISLTDRDYTDEVMIDCMDDFKAAISNALRGYYRQSIGCLRGVLELSAIGACCQLNQMADEFSEWRTGQREIGFGLACDRLRSTAVGRGLEDYLTARLGDSIFTPRSTNDPGGWARRHYSGLSNYLHSRPTYTNADIWRSNGPIFVPTAFGLASELFFQTSALSLLLVRMAKPTLELTAPYLGMPDFVLYPWKDVCRTSYSYFS